MSDSLSTTLPEIVINSGTLGPIAIAPGQTCRVELLDLPSAGYFWSLLEAPLFLAQIAPEKPAETQLGPNSPIGGASPLTLRFAATDAGEGRVTLRYGRPWEATHHREIAFVFECREPKAHDKPAAPKPGARAP